MWIAVVALAQRYQPDLYKQLLGFPDDLPDLSTRMPPDGNTRPDGVADSFLAQRNTGTLPETY